MSIAGLILASLATWRVTHLVNEDGPWDLIRHIRSGFAALGAARLVACFLCASVWIAIPFAWIVSNGWREFVLAIPALSGAAVLLERGGVRHASCVHRRKGGVVMSCCGGNKTVRTNGVIPRTALRTAPVQASMPRVVVFRNDGTNSILAFGRVTGRKYRFERPGAEVAVDPRDAPSMATIADLSEVRRT